MIKYLIRRNERCFFQQLTNEEKIATIKPRIFHGVPASSADTILYISDFFFFFFFLVLPGLNPMINIKLEDFSVLTVWVKDVTRETHFGRTKWVVCWEDECGWKDAAFK